MSLGFYFNGERCVGCRACQVACKDRLNIHKAGPRPRRVDTYETGVFPSAKMYHIAISCNHCDNPACVANCPTGAMFKDADGIVLHDDAACIKCQMCVNSCPYGAPQVVPELDGLIVKCDSCKALRDAGMNPVCVDACAMRALDFGDMDELAAKYGDGLVSELPCTVDAGQTASNLLVRPKAASLEGEFRPISL